MAKLTKEISYKKIKEEARRMRGNLVFIKDWDKASNQEKEEIKEWINSYDGHWSSHQEVLTHVVEPEIVEWVRKAKLWGVYYCEGIVLNPLFGVEMLPKMDYCIGDFLRVKDIPEDILNSFADNPGAKEAVALKTHDLDVLEKLSKDLNIDVRIAAQRNPLYKRRNVGENIRFKLKKRTKACYEFLRKIHGKTFLYDKEKDSFVFYDKTPYVWVDGTIKNSDVNIVAEIGRRHLNFMFREVKRVGTGWEDFHHCDCDPDFYESCDVCNHNNYLLLAANDFTIDFWHEETRGECSPRVDNGVTEEQANRFFYVTIRKKPKNIDKEINNIISGIEDLYDHTDEFIIRELMQLLAMK